MYTMRCSKYKGHYELVKVVLLLMDASPVIQCQEMMTSWLFRAK